MINSVEIKRSSNLCEITPWIPSLIPELTFTRSERVPVPGRKIGKTKYIKEKLYTVRGDSGYFPGGVYHRVIKHLSAKNIGISYTDYRDLARLMPDPDFTQVEALRTGQDIVLIEIATKLCGRVVCNTGWGKSFLIKQICAMYPDLKIVIVSPNRDDILNIYDRLAPAFHAGTVGLIGAGKKDSNQRRIVCTTARSIMHADLKGCDLLLFDEVHACGYNQLSDALKWVGDARMFGFTASPTGRSDGCDMISEAYFGPVIAEYEYEDSVAQGTAAPIEVHLYEVPGKRMYYKTPVSKKRYAYWRNTIRNYMIAYLAKAVPDDEQTLIMVETTEHGMYLKRLLPDFVLVYGSINKEEHEAYVHDGFTADEPIRPKERERIKKAFAKGEIKKAICTGVWKQAVKSAPLMRNFEVKKYSFNCWKLSA